MGWSLKSLIPKNTILGKALDGNISGAISSAKNYVTSGELATDFKNIATQNVGAIAKKAVMGYEGNGNLIESAKKAVLDKGTNITSLKPTPTQAVKADQAQASANIALAVGSGVPIAQASKMQGNEPALSGGMVQDTPPPADGETKKDNTLYYVLGGAAALLLLSKKKRSYVRNYARRTYAKGRVYARRYTRRAMSYRTKRRY